MHLCAKSGQKLIWNCNQNSVLHNPQSFSFICSVCIPEYSSVVWVLSLFEESANSNNLNGAQMYACIFSSEMVGWQWNNEFWLFWITWHFMQQCKFTFWPFPFWQLHQMKLVCEFWTNFNVEVLYVSHIWAKRSTPKRTQKRVNACMSLSRSQRIIA